MLSEPDGASLLTTLLGSLLDGTLLDGTLLDGGALLDGWLLDGGALLLLDSHGPRQLPADSAKGYGGDEGG